MFYYQRYHSGIGRDWFGNQRDWLGNWYVSSRNCQTFAAAQKTKDTVISGSGKPSSESYDAMGYGYLTLDHFLRYGVDLGVQDVWYWYFDRTYGYDYDNTFEYSMSRDMFNKFFRDSWSPLGNGASWSGKFDSADKDDSGSLDYDEWYDFWANISDIRMRDNAWTSSREP